MRPLRACALMLVLLLVGGHTAALQLAGWAGMLAERTQSMALGTAVRTTFDGSSPCRICYAVRDLQQTTAVHAAGPVRKAALPQPDFAPLVSVVLPEPSLPLTVLMNPAAWVVPGAWRADVPTPPPRGV